MPRFVKMATVEELPPGAAKEVEFEGRVYALFNAEGTITAIDGICPHQGGPLGRRGALGHDRDLPLARMAIRRLQRQDPPRFPCQADGLRGEGRGAGCAGGRSLRGRLPRRSSGVGRVESNRCRVGETHQGKASAGGGFHPPYGTGSAFAIPGRSGPWRPNR